jgi:hypothetical protein
VNHLKLQKLKINDWTWHLPDTALLFPWFADYPMLAETNKVKANDLRTVFTVESEIGTLFVKYDCPDSVLNKLKALLRSKVELEFESAMLLEKYRIPCVEYLGWGTNGSQGMLISMALEEGINARDGWFENSVDRQAFLAGLAAFLKLFLGSGLYHPDLHLGNLMYLPSKKEFCLVDPYGIRKTNLSESEIFDMQRLIGALRGELNDDEAAELLIATDSVSGTEDAMKLWRKIKDSENQEMDKLWPKRKEQILSGGGKYCSKITGSDGKEYLVRGTFSGSARYRNITPEILDSLREQTFSLAKGEQIWLESFRKEFRREPIPELPLIRKDNGDKIILYF